MTFLEKRNLIIFQSITSDIELYTELSAYQWEVYIASTIEQASTLLQRFEFHVGLCLIESHTPSPSSDKPDHYTTLNQLFNLHSNINWIMGLHGDVSPIVNTNSIESQLIAEYCFDYVTLPIDIKQLAFILGHAQGMNKIIQSFQKQTADDSLNFGIIGSCPIMLNLFKLLEKIAKEDYSVLIQGETGTGKELIANAIHHHSSRSEKPLVVINCGVFPRDLIQAELFGHEKGAFTGAQQLKIGCIEAAQGGTLFLDEVGDLPYEQQVNLLRFLEDRTIRRIGGSENIPVDVRVIAATHVDLDKAVDNKEFRADLFYRLQVLKIENPPLRDRDVDIELLAWYFFNKFSANNNYRAKGFQVASLKLMRIHLWPGNVRELMNRIRHAIVMSENIMLTPEDLGFEPVTPSSTDTPMQTLEQARGIADRDLILATLKHTDNNISLSAEIMGISRVSLYRLIDKYAVMKA